MIPISVLERTAGDLMAKAAIEIPDDYLGGLRRCADTEKGDLSAFVIKAMLENYEAAKEDRRAMCGASTLRRLISPTTKCRVSTCMVRFREIATSTEYLTQSCVRTWRSRKSCF